MNKRAFLKKSLLVSAGITLAPSMAMAESMPDKSISSGSIFFGDPIFELPKLPYGYNAFPETIDPLTMEIHYTKHHKAYTDNLNKALQEGNIKGKSIEDIMRMDNLSPAIRNNGGGYYNHNLYWDILTPGGTMSDHFKNKITADFGSTEALMKELSDAGAKRFGSGWAWLCQDRDGKLFVSSTPNQDNPLMKVAERAGNPILGIDVWEHAYYLKYQNKRGDYLQNILKIINWEKVAAKMV
jgi:Fe-Mn family superoxide dismutase